MDSEARVMIDSKEGVIEIEGPIEFVEKYMAMYAPGVKAPKVSVKPTGAKRRSSKKICKKTVKFLIGEGFFAQGRGFGEIKAEFVKRDGECSDASLRNALKETLKKGRLSFTGIGRGSRYSQPAVTPAT